MLLDRLNPWALVLLAVSAGLTCQLLLGTSYVAASLDPLREEGGVPVAVVILDEGEHGNDLLARFQQRESPIEWVRVATRDEALDGMERKEYFGALIVPTNFSANLDSFASQDPTPAFVETFANPGASTSGSLIATRGTEIALDATRFVVRQEAIRSATLATAGLGALTLDQARFVAEPIQVRHAEVNSVPERGANGLAPTYLAMAAWIGGYLGSVALERFREKTGLTPIPRAGILAGAALLQGGLATLGMLAIGLSVRDAAQLALLLSAGTWMAYALVSLFMDIFGLAGILPAFAILALGLPASGGLYPSGLLPDLYRSLHEVDPFTWLIEGLRTTLYAPDAGDLGGNLARLAALAGACTLASIGIGFLRRAQGARP